jgi:hypothetical protein
VLVPLLRHRRRPLLLKKKRTVVLGKLAACTCYECDDDRKLTKDWLIADTSETQQVNKVRQHVVKTVTFSGIHFYAMKGF